MISEFHNLSDKIDRLAELTLSLRRENAALRQSNALLIADNAECKLRLAGAHQRVEALLAALPATDAHPGAEPEPEPEPEVESEVGADNTENNHEAAR